MKIYQISSFLALAVLLVGTFSSCLEDEVSIERKFFTDEDFSVLQENLNLPQDIWDYNIVFPNHVGGISNVDNKKAMLGRVLFYDNKLSANEKVNCSSCHLQDKGFADTKAQSEGFDGELTPRNSLSLGVNVRIYDNSGSSFFWDERASNVQEQSVETIQNAIEMGMNFGELVERLKAEPHYQILFRKAFPELDNRITEQTITAALSEFVNGIASFNSKFDEGMKNRGGNMHGTFSNFTAAENQGKTLFQNHCQSCHGNNTNTFERIANNGLDLVYEDKGIGERTERTLDYGVFKVPLLRNIELTAPYMHDGRFDTLEEVVEHYNSGLKNHSNLDNRLKNFQNNEPIQLNLTEEEKAALVAFMKTLTDETLATTERFSDPFKR